MAGVGVAVALTATITLGGGLPATADAVHPDDSTPVAVEPSPAEMRVEIATGENPAFDADATRAVPIFVIIGAVISGGGLAYNMGVNAGERVYHNGIRNPEYQANKWGIRAMVIAALGPVAGGLFISGFENKFYFLVG
ncbi:hypothetical protein [Plantibacter sp. YIM 135249]|uniref:hypothetical protein n=1 Tax=Plantibacter sp. YIM 135249 TaxID=3423918 RepID=UPI003D327E43